MQKKLLFNIVLLLLVNLLVKPFWILGIDRTFQNQVGLDAYGLYANMFGLSLILTMLLDFGINNFNSSTIANNPEKVSEQFSSLFSLKLILSSAYFILTCLLAYLYGYSEFQLGLLLLLAFNQIAANFSTFVRSCITGLQYFKTDAILSSVDRFVMILLGLLMLGGIFFKVSIQHFILIQSLGYLAVFITSMVILSPKLQYFRIRFDTQLLKSLLIKTFPYALLALIMLLYSKSDILLMKKLLVNGDLENGIYASGGRLLDAANQMVGASAVIMLPFFARMIASNENLTQISELLSTFILLPVMIFALTCFTYGSEIMHMLSPESNDYTSKVFSVLILCFIPFGFMYTYGSMLTAKAEMKILNSICGIALAMNILLNLILIPRYAALGAAISALITQSIVGFGKFFFAVKKLHLSHSIAYLFKLLGFIPVEWLLLNGLNHLGLHFIPALLISLLMMAIWIILTGMIDLKGIIQQARQNFNLFRH